MKKVLSVFLCCFVLFNSVATPASAVKVEEVATFEDAEGHEIRVLSYGVAPANAAAGVLYLTSTGGSMGAGVASIASAALPVLGYVLAAGVIVYSVVGLAGCVMDIYNMLSADAKADLEQIELNETDSYTLSEYGSLSFELQNAFENRMSMGEFSVSFSVDTSLFPVYEQSNYYVRGNDASVFSEVISRYEYSLTSEPTLIEGTSVSVSWVDAPFAGFSGVSQTLKKCLKISNSVTGVSLYYVPNKNVIYSFEAVPCLSFYFARPTYLVNSGSNPYIEFRLPVMRVCNNKLNTGTCSEHGSIYGSYTEGEFSATASDYSGYFYFTGTNNPSLDNVLFRSNNVLADKASLTPSSYLHPDMSDVVIPGSALSLVLSDNFANVGVTDAPAIPEEDKPIFLPPSVALDNANLLTQSGALTGTWDTTIDGEKVETDTDVPGVDTEVGFWESILNWLEGFWDKFVEMLKTALMSLFVPSEGFFEDFIASISATFEDRMGILTYPISLLYEFCNHLLEVGQREPIFRWPGWSYQGTEFISAGSFNFNDILKNDTFKGLHDIYLLIVDAGIVWGLLTLLQKKYDSIIHH